jgi:hypothetical protein
LQLEFRENEPRPNLAGGGARDDAAHPVQPPNIICFAAVCLNYILCDLRQHGNKHMRDIVIFILDLNRFEVLAPAECCAAATGG